MALLSTDMLNYVQSGLGLCVLNVSHNSAGDARVTLLLTSTVTHIVPVCCIPPLILTSSTSFCNCKDMNLLVLQFHC